LRSSVFFRNTPIAARNRAANSTRYSISTAAPSTGAAMRMNRKEPPQMAASRIRRRRLVVLMRIPVV
jgi:hypothetical protein